MVTAGGDTDTNASIAGQIVGTWVGYEALPGHLMKRLPDWEDVLQEAVAFAKYVVES